MAYIPVPLTARLCTYCQRRFEAKDRRRIYCSSSCNTLAWMSRRGSQQTHKEALPAEVSSNLSFSVPNVSVVALGAGVTAIANYIVNDRPSQERITNLLESIKKNQRAINLTRLAANIEYLVDFVEAQVNADSTLGPRMLQIHNRRLPEAKPQSLEVGQDGSKKLI